MFVETQLNDIIELSENISVYNDGKQSVYSQNDLAYEQIIEGWLSLTENAYEMPAFGVSLNKQTIEALGAGLWVEFAFNKQYAHNEMPFEKLLVNVVSSWQGFNITRYNQEGGYDGRCFYINLVGKDMSDFYDILVNL